MTHLLYNISVRAYASLILFASIFNSKAELWTVGRKKIFLRIKGDIKGTPANSSVVWFHCASLGEFEQGRPLIEKLKSENPSLKVVLTFFSPSGFEIQKKYAGADFIYYLPIDTPSNAKRFIDIVKPAAVFFVKYEFWFNYLIELRKNKIPTYLISGVFRDSHYFFKFYASWFRKQLNCFSHFYLQSVQSEQLLNAIGYHNTTVSGDTRFDRVFEISKTVFPIPIVEEFRQDKPLLIAGSTWFDDEKIVSMLKLLPLNIKLIIAPHEIDEAHLNSIEVMFNASNSSGDVESIRFSNATSQNIKTANVLIVDNIGMLSSLYQYASIAYIGGGFSKGVHNILEPATFGMPIIFGPNYQKFTEAIDLIKLKGAFSITSINELSDLLESFKNDTYLEKTSLISKKYVSSHIGATQKIIDSIA